MNLGHAIKTIRKQSGITQGMLSKKTGISQTSLSRIEGGVKPTDNNLKKIAIALDVPPSVIYILGMEVTDVSKKKKDKYELLYPVLRNLALQIVDIKEME